MATHQPQAELGPGELIGGVLDDARELASAEIDKLKAEAKQVGETAKLTGIAIAFLVTAAVLIGSGAAFGIAAAGLPLWAAFLIVGGVFAILGVLVAKNGRALANAF